MRRWYLALFAMAVGCAGFSRDCQSSCAQSLGADWVIVQLRADGEIVNCWKLGGVAISNEDKSDGIYWKDPADHLVHISGWYNRVQVANGDYSTAARNLGVDLDRCMGGRYQPAKS